MTASGMVRPSSGPIGRAMPGWGECQMQHRHVQQINRDHLGISRAPLCACFAIRADGCMLSPRVTPLGDQK
jgi:hypothetical protein